MTQILADSGHCDYSFVDEELLRASAKRGQSVHWLCELEDEGALDYRTVPKRLRGYRKAYRDWKRASGFVPMWIEQRFVSDFGFAGTLDRYGWLGKTASFSAATTALVDLKTGPIHDATRLQLCAYSLAVSPMLALARTIRRIALRLDANGTYNVKEWPMSGWDQDIAEFMSCLESLQRR